MGVRRLKPMDRQEWRRMRRALWPRCADDVLDAEMASILADHDGQAVFVAVRPGGGLGGFLETSIHPHAIGCQTHPVGYVEGWYVDPEWRRTKVGRKLLYAAEAWALAQGCREMASDTLESNRAGLAAHLACGYVETGRLIHFNKRLA